MSSSKLKVDFSKFENRIGFSFKNKDLLTQAFIHRSYLNENRTITLPHNERLEFLGDAVLELVVTDYLFRKFPDKNEGEMTAYRAALVNTNTLSAISEKLGVNDFILLSKGESKDTGRARQYILANTFEAIVGALYLDQGYEVAQEFVGDSLFHLTDDVVSKKLWQDAKSHFQEMAQDVDGVTPNYETLRESGPDHDKQFVVGVFIGKNLIAEGEGKSKQEAEQEAAKNGLKKKNWE
jgi:ribonuclease-3